MAISLESIRRVVADTPPITIIYGVNKIGKTRLASEWPSPVFIQAERGTPGGVELNSFGTPQSFNDLLDALQELVNKKHDYKTVVIDSADAVEDLVKDHVCEENGWKNLEQPGYGKGYKYTDAPWREFMSACIALKDCGIAVVIIAHCDTIRFDSPVTDPYARYVFRIDKRPEAILWDDADIVIFLNYKHRTKEKEVGFQNKVTRGVGGDERFMFFQEMPGFMAGNRYGIPPELQYKLGHGYEVISQYFPQPTGKKQQAA